MTDGSRNKQGKGRADPNEVHRWAEVETLPAAGTELELEASQAGSTALPRALVVCIHANGEDENPVWGTLEKPTRRREFLKAAEAALAGCGAIACQRQKTRLLAAFHSAETSLATIAGNAILATLDVIRRSRSALGDRRGSAEGVSVSVSAGLSVGGVTVALSPDPGQASLMKGGAVERAKYLASPPGAAGVAICAELYREVMGRFVCRPRPKRRGKPDPAPNGMEVLREVPRQSLLGPLDHFHGRRTRPMGMEQPLRRLVAALENCREYAQSGLVTITGSRGTGKTRLAFEFLRTVRQQFPDCRPLQHSVQSQATEASFESLRDLLLQAVIPDEQDDDAESMARFSKRFGELASRADENVFGGMSQELARAALRHVLGEDIKDDKSLASVAANPGRIKEVAFRAVGGLFRLLARERPIIVLLDNAHLLDSDTLELMAYLAEPSALSSAPFLLVLVTQSPPPAELTDLIGSHGSDEIRVGDCSARQAREIAQDLLRAAGTIPAPFLDKLVQLCDGNPRRLVEIIDYHIDAGAIDVSQTDWRIVDTHVRIPPTLEATIAARIRRLPMEEQLVLRCASVAGETFLRDQLEFLLDGHPAARELHRLKDRGFLTEHRAVVHAGAEPWRFAQTAVRQSLYDSLPQDQARRLHAKVVDWLEQRDAGMPASHELLASHAEASGRVVLAIDSYLAAGKAAGRSFGTRAALRNLQNGMRLMDLTGQRKNQLAATALELGEAHLSLGDLPEAGRCFDRVAGREEAGVAPPTAGSSTPPVSSAQSFRARLGLGTILAIQGQPDAALRLYATLEGLAAVIPGGEALEAQRLCQMASTFIKLSRPDKALATVLPWTGQRLKSLVSVDPILGSQVVEFMKMQATALLQSGRLDEARKLYSTALGIARSTGDPASMAFLETNLGNSWMLDSQVGKAVTHYRRALKLVDELGHSYGKAILRSNLGECYLRLGRLDAAEAELRASLQLSSSLAYAELVPETLRLTAEVARQKGELDLALAGAKEAVAAASQSKNLMVEVSALLTVAGVLIEQTKATKSGTLLEEAGGAVAEAMKLAKAGQLVNELGRAESVMEVLRHLQSELRNTREHD